MNDSITQLIKDKLDIVTFLKQYITLTPAGKNFKANCPFHKEKTPSFMVSVERQSWHCFGSCSTGGDVISFLMKYENMEFYDALKVLAEKSGVDMRHSGNRDFQSHNTLYAITNDAKEFFKTNLVENQKVQAYLRERGLLPATIAEFEVGVAPDGSDILTRYLLKKGYAVQDIERAGFALKTERGTYWDRFRSRIMFPIYNHVGKAIAFTGRLLPGDENPRVGKYVNSPETPIFQKSKILYGFHKTKNDIRELKSAVIVEGQMDFLMIWQDGVKNAVASSGTALTSDHLMVLRRLTDEVVFSFDNDEAGHAAAERSIDLAQAQDFTVRLLFLVDASLKDPADIVRAKPGMMIQLITEAKSGMEYYFHRYIKSNEAIKDKKQNLRIVLAKIKNLSSPIDQAYWLQQLGARVHIDEQVLREEMALLKVNADRSIASPEAVLPEKISRRELIAQRLLGILASAKTSLLLAADQVICLPKAYMSLYESIIEKSKKTPGGLEDLMTTISLRFSFENQHIDEKSLQKETRTLLTQLKIEFLKERRQDISALIHRLEENGDEQGLQNALKEFDVISKELHTIV